MRCWLLRSYFVFKVSSVPGHLRKTSDILRQASCSSEAPCAVELLCSLSCSHSPKMNPTFILDSLSLSPPPSKKEINFYWQITCKSQCGLKMHWWCEVEAKMLMLGTKLLRAHQLVPRIAQNGKSDLSCFSHHCTKVAEEAASAKILPCMQLPEVTWILLCIESGNSLWVKGCVNTFQNYHTGKPQIGAQLCCTVTLPHCPSSSLTMLWPFSWHSLPLRTAHLAEI